jgi:hypothetical protein
VGFWVAHLLHVIFTRNFRSRSDLAFAGDGDAIGQRIYLRRDLRCIESNRLKAKASAQYAPSASSDFLIAFPTRNCRIKLGLEKVFVQAKRWQNPVGPEAVQAFYGALEGRRANKGVFITTSTFTPGAAEFARLVEKIVLIAGLRLADLMMEYGVGVSHRIVKIPKVDSDYFEE